MSASQSNTHLATSLPFGRALGPMEKFLFVALLAVLIAAIALLDLLTGKEISFSIFYIYPIFTASWHIGRNTGIVLAILSSVLSLGADLASGAAVSHILIPGWNAAVRLVFFVLIGVSVPYLKLQLQASHKALSKLSSLLPLCAWCKNIRDANGRWLRPENYLEEETGVEVTHGICPECIEKYYSSRRRNTSKPAAPVVA